MEKITDRYALYNNDCMEVMKNLDDNSVDMVFYSPPFDSMYVYSGDDRDLSNNTNYEDFLKHYEYIVKETARLVKKGRIVAIHCMEIPKNGDAGQVDLPGDIIRLHKKHGFSYWDRKSIWKDPLLIAIRTRQRALVHGQLVKDSSKCRGVLADYILVFKKSGENEVPINHQYGLTRYAGDLDLMNKEEQEAYKLLKTQYVEHTNDKTNRLSQFIWKRYADCLWDDIRSNQFMDYREAKEKDDTRHLTPTSLDAIERVITMYSNKDEIIFDPFNGVGSTVYKAIELGRKGIGAELKESYFKQSIKNISLLENKSTKEDMNLFGELT